MATYFDTECNVHQNYQSVLAQMRMGQDQPQRVRDPCLGERGSGV